MGCGTSNFDCETIKSEKNKAVEIKVQSSEEE